LFILVKTINVVQNRIALRHVASRYGKSPTSCLDRSGGCCRAIKNVVSSVFCSLSRGFLRNNRTTTTADSLLVQKIMEYCAAVDVYVSPSTVVLRGGFVQRPRGNTAGFVGPASPPPGIKQSGARVRRTTTGYFRGNLAGTFPRRKSPSVDHRRYHRPYPVRRGSVNNLFQTDGGWRSCTVIFIAFFSPGSAFYFARSARKAPTVNTGRSVGPDLRLPVDRNSSAATGVWTRTSFFYFVFFSVKISKGVCRQKHILENDGKHMCAYVVLVSRFRVIFVPKRIIPITYITYNCRFTHPRPQKQRPTGIFLRPREKYNTSTEHQCSYRNSYFMRIKYGGGASLLSKTLSYKLVIMVIMRW